MTNAKHWTKWLKTAVGCVIVALYLIPVYWMAATSLKPGGDIFAVPPQIVPSHPQWTSYATVLQDPAIRRAFLNSLIISSGTTVLTLCFATPAAYALARLKLRIAALTILVLLISQMLPTINLAVPLFVIFSRFGLINSYPALILANTVFALPLAITILRPLFLNLPRELEDAAKVDGCTLFGAFWRVILPLVRPGLLTVGTVAFVLTWGELVFGLTLTTKENMQPITVALSNLVGLYGTRWNDMMAVSTATALPIVVVFVVLQKYIVSGLSAGAVKE